MNRTGIPRFGSMAGRIAFQRKQWKGSAQNGRWPLISGQWRERKECLLVIRHRKLLARMCMTGISISREIGIFHGMLMWDSTTSCMPARSALETVDQPVEIAFERLKRSS